MNPSYQRAILQSALDRENSELRLMHSGHRLGPTPPTPQIREDVVEQPKTPDPMVVTPPPQVIEKYFDKVTTTTTLEETKKENNKLRNALIGLLTAGGLGGAGYAGY